MARALQTVWALGCFAVGVEAQRVVRQFEAFVLGNRFLQVFNLGLIKLLDPATVQAHQVIVVLPLIELIHGFAALKMRATQEPGLLKLREHSVDRGQADIDVFAQSDAVDVFCRHVPMLSALEQLQNLQAWQGGFEACGFEVKHGRHGVAFGGWVEKRPRRDPGLRYNAPIIALSQRWIDMDSHTSPSKFGPRPFKGPVAVLLCALVLVLSACSYIDDPLSKLVANVNPYRIELIQGNVVTQEQLQVIRPGMNKNQIKEVLGTPLIVSLFHGDRWDYAFTIRRHGQPIQQRRLSVFFENDAMTRYDADPLPTEAEFAARIDIRRPSTAKIPLLQASPEQLAPFKPAPQNPNGSSGANGVLSGSAVSAQFPPLESP